VTIRSAAYLTQLPEACLLSLFCEVAAVSFS
jgi:hypothetical protein